MTLKAKAVLALVSLSFFTMGLGIIYVACQKTLAMPFRATNDTLHRHGAPVTLDFLIPKGVHIDEKMSIGEVVRISLEKPKGRFNEFVQKISGSIPIKYRLLGSAVLYLFWTLLFLVFFRIFTWMRYIVALSVSFLAGAVVYFFMPDMILGRVDDALFWGWAIAFGVTVRWYVRRRKLKSSCT